MAMNIELTELGRHEAWLRLSSIVKAGSKQVQLERKLTSELIKNWRESYEDALKELFKQIPDEVSEKAIDIITQGLADALGSSFGNSQKVRDELRKYITRAYQSGKSEFIADAKLNLSDVRAIEVLTRHNCYWLGEHYGKEIGEKIAELTQNALSDGLGRDELAKELRNALGGEAEGYQYWDVVSSAALVRSRSFGCISGMAEAGIVEYEILAMGDERMCPICDEMNGKTFSVTETQKVIDGVLDISNPEKFKEAMPWHTEPPVGVSKDKLIASGMSIPPFHARCRCELVMSSTDGSTEPEPSAEMIRGVSKDEIDRLRGYRSHSKAYSITVQTIQDCYKRVGIEITVDEAKNIYDAVKYFTGNGYVTMRDAFLKRARGEVLGESEQKVLQQYGLCEEFCRVMPVYQPSETVKEIYRGLGNDGGDYAKMLLGLQPGDTFDLQMPSSFSSKRSCSEDFAGYKGFLLHVKSDDIRDAPSIRGISHFPEEYEIFMSDYLWNVTEVKDERENQKDGYYHIYLKRKD